MLSLVVVVAVTTNCNKDSTHSTMELRLLLTVIPHEVPSYGALRLEKGGAADGLSRKGRLGGWLCSGMGL